MSIQTFVVKEVNRILRSDEELKDKNEALEKEIQNLRKELETVNRKYSTLWKDYCSLWDSQCTRGTLDSGELSRSLSKTSTKKSECTLGQKKFRRSWSSK